MPVGVGIAADRRRLRIGVDAMLVGRVSQPVPLPPQANAQAARAIKLYPAPAAPPHSTSERACVSAA